MVCFCFILNALFVLLLLSWFVNFVCFGLRVLRCFMICSYVVVELLFDLILFVLL